MKTMPIFIGCLFSLTIQAMDVEVVEKKPLFCSLKTLVAILGSKTKYTHYYIDGISWKESIELPDYAILTHNNSKKNLYEFIEELKTAIPYDIFLYIGSLLIDKKVWKKRWIQSYVLCKTLSGNTNSISSIVLDEEKRTLFASDFNGEIRVWNADSYDFLYTLAKHDEYISDLALDNNHNLLSCSWDGKVKWWDTIQRKCISTIHHPADASNAICICWHPRWRNIVYGLADQSIRIYDPKTKTFITDKYVYDNGLVPASIFDTESDSVISGTWDNNIQFIDKETMVDITPGHNAHITLLYKQPNSPYVYSGSHDTMVKRWDIRSKQCTKIYKGHTNTIMSLTYDSNNDILISGSKDGEIRFWNANTGKCLHSIQKKPTVIQECPLISSLCSDPKTNAVLAGSYDCSLTIWKPILPPSHTVKPEELHYTPLDWITIESLFEHPVIPHGNT